MYSAYRSYSYELGTVGLAKMRTKKRKEVAVVNDTIIPLVLIVELQESLQFVESQTDPKETMELHWVKSREKRTELLTQLSNIEYVMRFPVLQMGNGFE